MTRRKEKMLGGLWVYPILPGKPEEAEILTFFSSLYPQDHPQKLRDARHVFTHRIWEMAIWSLPVSLRPEQIPSIGKGRWVSREEMDLLPRPSAMRSACEEALLRLP